MNFAEILQTIIDECGGGLGAALMENDGIAIEQVEARGAEARQAFPSLTDDIAALGVEFGRILAECRKVSSSVGGGAIDETLIRMERYAVLLRVVDEDTFLVVVLAPEGNLGKTRFLMRMHLLALREQL